MTASYCRFRKEYPPAIAPFYVKERAVSGLCSNAINSRTNTTKGPGPPGIRVRQSATSVAKIRQGRAYAVRIRTRLPVRPRTLRAPAPTSIGHRKSPASSSPATAAVPANNDAAVRTVASKIRPKRHLSGISYDRKLSVPILSDPPNTPFYAISTCENTGIKP